MVPKLKQWLCGVLVVLVFLSSASRPVSAHAPNTVTVPAAPIPESRDFATLVLRDPWDMSEYTDISQYLNESGQRNLVSNPSVADGLFSGTSVGNALTGNGYFFPLFPGYDTAIQTGKVGSRFPIDKATYKCLHIAMKVNSTSPSGTFNSAPDQFRVFWFQDPRMTGAAFGQTQGIQLYSGNGQPAWNWNLYSVNLSTAASAGTAWNNMPSVEGLRIDPTVNANVAFAVDWVRLTDCAAVNTTLTWTNGNAQETTLWLQPVGTGRNIRVASGINGASGQYTLDTQGLAPGSYYVGLGTADTCCSDLNTTTPLVIYPRPIATFARPSFTSGVEYSEQSGKPWDFKDSADVTSHANFKSFTFQNGELTMVTASGPQPAGLDAQMFLNSPMPAAPTAYRYLTFRMSSQNGSAAWQDVVDGMIARWIWKVQGASGRSGWNCYLVSQDIPFDVGYQTYSIDLFNTFNGTAEAMAGECAGLPNTWTGSSPVLEMRFDPNENISCNPQTTDPTNRSFIVSTCGDYVQKLDWIRLTQMDSVNRGQPYRIEMGLNKTPASVPSITYYYTDDLNNKTKYTAQAFVPPTPAPFGAHPVFLPALLNAPTPQGDLPAVTNSVTYLWDTTNVSAGTYYVCTALNDGVSTKLNIYCSETPVAVR